MCCEQSTGLPKGRESYGDGASIGVSRRESRLHGHRGVKAAQGRSEAGFPWKGRQGTRDANSRHDPQHYLRPRQTIGQSQRNKETGEPDDATSIQSGSAGGWEKRPKWTSLAAYPAPTVCLDVTSLVVCSYGCGDGTSGPTRCALIDAARGDRWRTHRASRTSPA